MTDRRNGGRSRPLVGWQVEVVSAMCATLLRAQAPAGLAGAFAPERITRSVPLMDGYDLQFRRVGAEGLSQTRVAQIAQDDDGFMWFGTQRGLYRYDGQALRVYRNVVSQKTSLSGVYVHALLRGRANTLWVASDGALDHFATRTETSRQVPIQVEGEQSQPINISCMTEDASGVLWLCTRDGLYRFDPGTQGARVLRHQPGNATSLSSDAIQFVGNEKGGSVWVGTTAGLDRVDPTSLEVVSHLSLPGSGVTAALEDRFGVLWLIHGVDGQLAAFDKSANTLTILRAQLPGTETDPVKFSALLQDREGTLWFGTLNHGVLKFDRGDMRFVRYASDPWNPYSLSDRRVNVLYQDREGLIWAGLNQSEPNYFLPHPPSFRNIPVPGRQSTLVSAIIEDRSGLVWLGLDLGAKTLDRKTRAYRDVPGLQGKETTSIVESPAGIFWAGTAGQGLWRVDQRSGQARNFRHEPGRASSLPSDFVEQVKLDGEGAVWAVTWRGLARWDPSTNEFRTLMPPEAPSDLTLHTAMFATGGAIWIGSNFGVHRFDPLTQSFRWFRQDKADTKSLSNDRVNTIHEGADGSVWIATQIGLDHWDASARPLKRYTQRDGLPGTTVSCVLEQNAQTVWLSTERGIARLNVATGTFSPYGPPDGLPGSNMTGWSSCARASSGEMFFAGFAGAVSFFPQNVVDREYPMPVVLTGFRLLDATFEEGGRRFSSVPVRDGSEITLQPSQGKFAVDFAALSFRSPETNRLRFRLSELQDEWTEVYGDQRDATYMALPPGTYSFQVQGASGHGAWSPAATLRIVMLPPWWRSAPFYLLATITVIGMLYLAYRLRVRQLTHAFHVQHEARWAERTRIARELHDTLLQGFQGLMFRLQAVRDLLPAQPGKAIPVLDVALLKGEEAIDDARSAVSDLRASERVDRDLTAGLSAIAAAAAHIPKDGEVAAWDVASTGRVREIPSTVLYEIYKVAQEAISNTFRHARATRLTVDIHYGRDDLRVTIVDDGLGFDEAVLASRRSSGHFGVQGMRERIERLGGDVTLDSRPGQGTRVSLSVPSAVAYTPITRNNRLRALFRWRTTNSTADHD